MIALASFSNVKKIDLRKNLTLVRFPSLCGPDHDLKVRTTALIPLDRKASRLSLGRRP
jgi:hypothetical protein